MKATSIIFGVGFVLAAVASQPQNQVHGVQPFIYHKPPVPQPLVPVYGQVATKDVEALIAEFRDRAAITSEISDAATDEGISKFYSGLSSGYAASANMLEQAAVVGWKVRPAGMVPEDISNR